MTQLIVPIRDRRTSRRIVTLKNFGRVAIALAVLFVGLTIQSEMRHHGAVAEYGRLFGTQVNRDEKLAKPKYDVVKEAPVADQTAADPLLMEPAARAQQFGIGLDPIAPPAAAPADTTASGDAFAPRTAVLKGSTNANGVSIVGGSGGVTIVKGGDQQRPTLSGGIFKQP